MQALKEFQKQYGEAEQRVAELKQLLSGLSAISDAAEVLAPVQEALVSAERQLSQLAAPTEDDYVVANDIVAYPNPHTLWDQITVPAASASTIRRMVDFFQEKHGLTLASWAVRTATGEGRSLYPTEKPLLVDLLPSFDLTFTQATREIFANTKIREKQRYINKWKELNAGGPAAVAAAVAQPVPMVADDDLPLAEVLQHRAGIDVSKRRRLHLDGLVLENADGDVLETAKVVLHLD